MKRFIYYILPLLSLLAFSCKDDFSLNNVGTDDGSYLSLTLDIPELRTRTIDMTPGAAMHLNKIWVGIYKKSTGVRVGGTSLTYETDLESRLTASGVKLLNIVKIEGYDNTVGTSEDLCVVAVANYDNIKTNGGGMLFDALKNAKTWKQFTDIAINTQQEFPNETPVLIGYLYKESSDHTEANYKYTQVDQTKEGTGIHLYNHTESEIFTTAKSLSGGYLTALNSSGSVLKLRRLLSKINIRIKPAEGISITNMEYKVVNSPKSAFLAQRRTNDFKGDFASKTTSTYSPNSADVMGDGYYDDEWINPQDNSNFSFEHFENKHWAKNTGIFNNNDTIVKNYHKRELKDSDGRFIALADSKDDWNHNASYFILKMGIKDENKDRYAEVEYVVHEGFINDVNGTELNYDDKKRLEDFSCVRNTDYYYHININGVNDIVMQVTQNGVHEYDQEGSVWQINRLFTNKENPEEDLGKDGKTVSIADLNLEKGIVKDGNLHFVNPKDIAFRFIGAVHNGSEVVPIDICYNFAHGELDGFSNLWKNPGTHTDYLVDTDVADATYYLKNYTDPKFNELIEKIKVIPADGSKMLNIKEYIAKYVENYDENKSNNPNPDIEGFWLAGDSYSSRDENELRGLYIFDRESALLNGERVDYDSTSHGHPEGNDLCAFYQIYGVERYPVILKGPELVSFDIKNILWDNDYYKMVSVVDEVFAATTPIFYGSINSKIDLRWKHDSRISGYEISVFSSAEDIAKNPEYNYSHPTIIISAEELPKYLKTVIDRENNEITIFEYPLSTANFATWSGTGAKNFSFDVTAIVDEEYIQGETTHIVHKMNGTDDTCIRICPSSWDFTSTKDWTDLEIAINKSFEVHYRGLNMFSTEISTDYKRKNDDKYLTFGGKGYKDKRYFSFWASKPGKFKVTCESHSAATDRPLIIVKMEGKEAVEIYNSGSMQAKTTPAPRKPKEYEIPNPIQLNDGEPTEFRIYNEGGGIDYYKIEFVPSN